MRERLGKELLYFRRRDGNPSAGAGTAARRASGDMEYPKAWGDHRDIHRQYYEAGSDIVLANTFGANALKFHDDTWPLKDVIFAAVENVKKARILAGQDAAGHYVALDMGPTGKLLEPMGDLSFDAAYEAFPRP